MTDDPKNSEPTTETDEDVDALDETDALTSVWKYQERIRDLVDPPALRAMREQEERVRDLVDPPALRAMREQEERIRDLVDPPALRAMREQEERMRDLVDPPTLRSMREQEERMRDLVDPPALRAMCEQEERVRDLLDPPGLRAMREQEERIRDLLDPPGLRTIREHQERIRDLVDPPGLRAIRAEHSRFRDLIAIPDHNAALLTSATAFGRSAEVFGRGASLIESALRLGHLEHQADAAALAAAGISRLAAEISVPAFEPVGELLDASVDFLDALIEDAPADLVAELPAEIFRALDLDTALRGGAESTAGDERAALASRTSDELEVALANYDPALATLLSGARRAMLSDNPDRTRHVCISLRELLGHALRQLATDASITAWTSNAAHFHNGRPTRKARLEYLYRSVTAPPLRSLIDADIRAALELFDALNAGTHVASLGASAAALLLLVTRAEGILLFLLRLTLRECGGT